MSLSCIELDVERAWRAKPGTAIPPWCNLLDCFESVGYEKAPPLSNAMDRDLHISVSAGGAISIGTTWAR